MKNILFSHFKNKLIRRFTVYSSIAFIVTGIVISIFISKHIENDAIDSKSQLVKMAIQTSISKDELVINGLKLGAEEVYFEKDTNQFIIEDQIKIKIDTVENKKKLYINGLALLDNSRVFFVFSFDDINEHIQMVKNKISLSVFLGFLILYSMLIKLIINSATQLEEQKLHIVNKNNELSNSLFKLNQSFNFTVEALAEAVDARDAYTAGHSRRVTHYVTSLGNEMGFSESDIHNLKMASLLHDIGKIGISDLVLHKNTKLTELEYDIIKTHPLIGVSILNKIPEFRDIIPLVYHHHERFNGSGYPNGIAGNEIPIGARIIAVADAFDAMTTNRPYREYITVNSAINELKKGINVQFDPAIIELFLIMLEKENWPIEE